MVNEQQTEFQNETLQVAVETLPRSRVMLKITVSPIALEATYRKAIKNVSKEISVPGFRKGKAPEKIILEQYTQYVDKEWRDLVVQTAFTDALRLVNIYPLNSSSVDKPRVAKCSREEGAEISITFERRPETPQVDGKALRIKKLAAPPITPEQVKQAIDELQRYHAKWEAVEPRPVKDGDYITLSIDTLDPQEARVCTDERFHVEKDQMIGWMYDLILGQEVNVPFEGTSQADESQGDAPFTPTRCRFTIQSILQQTLPPIDEALAKQAGCKDVEELEINVKKSLERRVQQQAESAMTHQLVEQLFELYPIDIPKSLLDYEVECRMRAATEAQASLGISEAEIRAQKANLTAAIVAEAERSLKLLFLLDEVMRRPSITVTKDDLVQALNQQRYLTSPVGRFIHGDMTPEEIRQRLLNHLFIEKAMTMLLKEATYE